MMAIKNNHWSYNEQLHTNWYIGLDSITKDLPSVLILIIADQILNDSHCCCYQKQTVFM